MRISAIVLFFMSGLTPLANAQLDLNDNGMSDLWERHLNDGELFPSSFLPENDDDHDGFTNLKESTAGTDPESFDPPDGHLTQTVLHIPAVRVEDPEEKDPILLSLVSR
jgi:hypothetical protein